MAGPGIIAALLLATSSLAVECSSFGVTDARVKTLSAQNESDASLIVSVPMLLKLQKFDYSTLVRSGSKCDRGSINVAGTTYRLTGENTDHGGVRRGVPSVKGKPVAVLLPVSDMMKILAAPKAGEQPPIEGYLLITANRSEEVTGWRLYSAIPVDSVLSADMADALSGKLPFIFRDDLKTGKITVSAQ